MMVASAKGEVTRDMDVTGVPECRAQVARVRGGPRVRPGSWGGRQGQGASVPRTQHGRAVGEGEAEEVGAPGSILQHVFPELPPRQVPGCLLEWQCPLGK